MTLARNSSVHREAELQGQRLILPGAAPAVGDRLSADFEIAAARFAGPPLSAGRVREGLALLSTLPNIHRHACLTQIVQLEELGHRRFPQALVAHVSADEPEHWCEVDHFHPNLRAPGFSLHRTDPLSVAAFVHAFGVAVLGHRRIAHGLFALRDGVFVAVEIPYNQMHPMDVTQFLARLPASV